MDKIYGAEFTYSKYSSRYDFAGGALQDLGIYTVYDAITLFGSPENVNYYPTMIESGVDGKGTAVLHYSKMKVILNFSKITNSNMNSEIYGGKDFISIDDAGELKLVEYIAIDGTPEVLGIAGDENSMVPETEDFAKIINNLSNHSNREQYEYWRKLMIQVNDTIYKLRQDVGIKFSLELGD